jgi:peroxiredoxin
MQMTRQAFLVGVALAATVGFSSAYAQSAARVGKAAPDFTVVDVDGKNQKLSDFAGKTVILEWTNHECPYVQKHYNSANMQTLQRDMAKDGTVWLSVISSAPGEEGYADAAKAKDLTKSRNAAPSNILLDPKGKMGRAYGAQTTPHMYIVDPKGTLVYAGAIDNKPSASSSSLNGAKNYVRQAIAELNAGKPVSEAATKSYGCSVKYAPSST